MQMQHHAMGWKGGRGWHGKLSSEAQHSVFLWGSVQLKPIFSNKTKKNRNRKVTTKKKDQ
uniref:Uncharacterized protein n=1 Tax=Rhizophora mucronata TaxID=61149 RepID=A0A2P2PQY9_RHIMU